MKGKVMDMRRNVLKPGVVGVIVAGDPPDSVLPLILEGKVEPVALKFRGADQEFEVPVRDLTPAEVCTVVGRALQEQKVVFGFAPNPNKPGQLIAPPV